MARYVLFKIFNGENRDNEVNELLQMHKGFAVVHEEYAIKVIESELKND